MTPLNISFAGLLILVALVVGLFFVVVLIFRALKREPAWVWALLTILGVPLVLFLVWSGRYRTFERTERMGTVAEIQARRSSAIQAKKVQQRVIRLHVPDDFKEWKKMDAVAPDVTTPEWVRDAAGSGELSWNHGSEFGRFDLRGRSPGHEGKLAAYSRQLEPTLEAARQSARQSAREHLQVIFIKALLDTRGSHVVQRILRSPDLALLVDRAVETRLPDLIVERFEQPVQRPAGTVYRAALLVKADQEALAMLRRDIEERLGPGSPVATAPDAEAKPSRRRWWTLWGPAGAGSPLRLVLFVFFIYCFLNAGTKGHFAWPLRILSVAALAVLVYWNRILEIPW